MRLKPALFAVVCVLVALAPPLAAQAPERIKGRVIDAGSSVPGPNSAFFTLHVDEYSTAADVQELAALLAKEGSNALLKKLRKMDHGYIRIGRSLGYPVAVIRSIETPEGRVIRAVTDRPIQIYEVMRSLRTEDYPFGVIEIRLPADGKGEGTLIAAAQVEYNKDGVIEIESFGIQPFRLMNVEAEKVKEKKKKKKD